MPELPEVAFAARVLTRATVGRKIVRLQALHPALKRKLPPAIARRAAGRTVTSVERRGKHQLLNLDDGSTIVVHFRMNGDWDVGKTTDPLPEFTRAVIEVSGGKRVALVDRRALSSVALDRKGESSLPKLGLDASDKSLDASYLSKTFSRRSSAVKTALMDQSVIAGLGNIYVAEALWLAQISPKAAAAKLSKARLEKLASAIKKVLGAEARLPGRYTEKKGRQRLAVYGREGEPCRRCDGTISRIVQAARSTYYCPGCQKS